MSHDEFITFISSELDEFKNIPGETLYSSLTTIQKGDIYLMGTNPGGSNNYPLSDDIENLKYRTKNSYLDEVWETKKGVPQVGKNPLQKRIQKLITMLGYDVRDVCASNLIFIKSVDLETLRYKFSDIADKCWGVHEKILNIVQPKIVIVFGNSDLDSPYAYLKKKYKNRNIETTSMPTGHGKLNAKSFSFILNGKRCHVVGLPHLSRFVIKNDEMYHWMKRKINY